MLYREIIAVCSQIHTKHINTLCGQSVEFWSVKLAVHTVTTGTYKLQTEVTETELASGQWRNIAISHVAAWQ